MSLKRYITAGLTAITMLFSYSAGIVSVYAETEPDRIVYERYEISQLDDLLSDFADELQKKDNESEIERYYQLILDEADLIETEFALAMVQYSKNMTDENRNEYMYMDSVGVTGVNKISLALQKGLKSQYKSTLKRLIGNNFSSSFETDDFEIDEETEQFMSRRNELDQKYIKSAYSSASPAQKNLECAEIYLDIAKLLNSIIVSDEYNYIDYAYLKYGRDYSAADIAAVSDEVRKSTVKSYRLVEERLVTSEYNVNRNPVIFDNNFEIADQFSYRISDELKQSARIVNEKGLYITGTGNTSEKKAYTTPLPYFDAAIIYQYLYGRSADLSSTVHEFGHFNAMRLDNSPYMYRQTNNLDIAEVHSQGLEVLYTGFYNEIYGGSAELLRLKAALDLLSSISAGFMGNEFEYYVFSHADSMTPQDVVDKYNEIMGKYEIYSNYFYNIPHFFQSPGYYISYAVSALASFDLWDIMNRDYDRAVEMYTAFSHISNSGDMGFTEALRQSGFDNIFDSAFISERLPAVASLLAECLVYGDADINGSVNSSDMVFLIKILTDLDFSDYRTDICDLDDSGTVDVKDILKMKEILLRS